MIHVGRMGFERWWVWCEGVGDDDDLIWRVHKLIVYSIISFSPLLSLFALSSFLFTLCSFLFPLSSLLFTPVHGSYPIDISDNYNYHLPHTSASPITHRLSKSTQTNSNRLKPTQTGSNRLQTAQITSNPTQTQLKSSNFSPWGLSYHTPTLICPGTDSSSSSTIIINTSRLSAGRRTSDGFWSIG